MSKKLSKSLRELVKELIFNVSGFDEQSEYYETIEDFAFSHICSPDYFFDDNRHDIEKRINNLSEKIKFHGFSAQANAIQKLTKTILDSAANKEDLEKKLFLVKLMILLSYSPTTHYIENPSFYQPKLEEEEEEIVDWSSLLNETRSTVVQTFSDSSEEWSELSETSSEGSDSILRAEDQVDTTKTSQQYVETKPTINLREQARIAKDELINSIQYKWWNDSKSIDPTSHKPEANVALNWNSYQYEASSGLYNPTTKIIPEYKIMREIIWQLFSPTSCCCFAFEGNQLVPKDDVTIASVRANSMKLYLRNFLPYFEMLKVFRNFKDGLDGQYFVISTPDTYRSYYHGVEEILEPVYEKIMEIEDNVRKQDETMTILSIAKQLRPLFLNVELLYKAHLEIFQNRTDDLGDSFKNTTFLLSKLYFTVLNSSDKKEQNLFLSLYLNSLYKYFTTIEIWLRADYLNEETDEFLITRKMETSFQSDVLYIDYKVKELDPFSKMDGMLLIICEKIVRLAKNIHLLRLLGKLHLVTEEQGTQQVSLHEEYVNKVIEKARKYIQKDDENPVNTSEVNSIENSEDTSALTVICPEQKQSVNGIDSIENFVDFSDGFLVTVFDDYLYQKPSVMKEKKQNLFSKINENITKLFPAKQILEKSFLEVLETRYSVPGLVVKNIFINQFELKKYFSLMKHLYLFVDDLIFPFYKFMFIQYENQANMWGNFFWLTSQLQDLLMDLYPDSYESFRVDVAPNWRTCTSLVLGCDLVTVHTKIKWPINLIIRPEHIVLYNKVFQFILKIKWALNTLNKLKFTDIEPRSNPFAQQPNLIKKRIRLLQNMRFFLLSDMTSIQHYILGHLIHVLSKNFDKDLEAAYDLETIRKAHDTFIKRIYSFCMKLKDEKSDIYGFKKILSLVGHLQIMWNNIYDIEDKFLGCCEIDYRRCHKFLRPIIQMETINF